MWVGLGPRRLVLGGGWWGGGKKTLKEDLPGDDKNLLPLLREELLLIRFLPCCSPYSCFFPLLDGAYSHSTLPFDALSLFVWFLSLNDQVLLKVSC